MFYGNFRDSQDVEFLKNAIERFKTMFSGVYAGDNAILFDRSLGFLEDQRFMSAFTSNVQSDQEQSLILRLNTLIWAAQQALTIEGDFVECGVFRGFSFAVIADYLEFGKLDKTLYLYDTFEGIPEKYNSENRDAPEYAAPGIHEGVVQRFSRYPNVRIVKGIVPETFADAAPEKISLLHLDLNSSKAEIAALEALFDRVSSGGVIIFDDYGWAAYRAQRLAEDEFMAERGYRILEIPTGQGLAIKR
ncbi:MAG: TylF/MycF family methyltransferase [Gammaproteobacteria bacterium]|nr:TylF/MycF family methyltransferase [Gammaproteobacteria bacterium]